MLITGIQVLHFYVGAFIYFFIAVHSDASNLPNHMQMSVKERYNLLQNISNFTTGTSGRACGNPSSFHIVQVPIHENLFHDLKIKVDLIGNMLRDVFEKDMSSTNEYFKSMVCRTLLSSPKADAVRIIMRDREEHQIISQERTKLLPKKHPNNSLDCQVEVHPMKNPLDAPWFKSSSVKTWNVTRYQRVNGTKMSNMDGFWTYPYFLCNEKRWKLSYVKPFGKLNQTSEWKLSGHLSVDVDISNFDINQCTGNAFDVQNITNQNHVISFFENTHKCTHSSQCVFQPGFGWRRGGYTCECQRGFYSPTGNTFRGSLVEVTWSSKMANRSTNYDEIYTCVACSKGCYNCTDGSPCEAEYNVPFRIALLVISVMCIVITIIMMVIVYHYRSMKVFKVASPPFLEICLIGCIVMYLEMASIFPVLDTFFCICTKWTRHMGFCITFSSLLMKTWRVSLTYRVKSAHKIKLTDKQLLQWMTPIILIMTIYLGSWTISHPPKGEMLRDGSNLLFTQCTYNAWDHVLAVGEMMFLLWGVKVCLGVRKAESFFDEAKCISWAVYNITIVNIIMACFHIYILPNAGPDLKYFFGFIRTQMSTTTTIGLVFGPKLYRMLNGTGDQLDNRVRAKGLTASFSINGISGGDGDEPPDPLEENEELKDEIQKLAAQIEFMKIVHMEMNNRHLKPKPGGYFSEKNQPPSNNGQSPSVTKNSLSKLEVSENSSSGLAPLPDPNPEKV